MPKFAPNSAKATRSTGMLVALAFALIAIGVVIAVAVAYRPARQPVALAPDVIDIGKAPLADADGGLSQVSQTGTARLQFVDRDDPGRLAAELLCDRLDPMGQGYYTLSQPRAWVYFKDGRVMHVRADSARIKMPSQQQQPESGEFYGTVVIRVFDPRDPLANLAAAPIDPEIDAPRILAVTDSLTFDTVLLELQTQDPVTISARNLLYEGDGLLVRVNEVRERIELLRTNGRTVRFNPELRDEPAHARAAEAPPPVAPDSTPVATTQAPPPSPPAPPPPPAPAPTEILYRAQASDRVVVRQAGRSLTADTLEIFARLIDGQLPPETFGKVLTESTPGPADDGAQPRREPEADAAAVPRPRASEPMPTLIPQPLAGSTRPLFISAGERDIVLTWSGPLVLTPIVDPQPPAELSRGNHFAARFSSVKPGGEERVRLRDEQSGATGDCGSIEYAATTRTLAMLAAPGERDQAEPSTVTLDMPETGRLVVPSIRMDLGSGVAHVAGAGQLAALKTPAAFVGPLPENDPGVPLRPEVVRQITWNDQADFEFAVRDGRLRGALRAARFTGDVLARDRFSSLSGDFLAADFVTQGRQQTALRRIRVEGNVIGVAGSRRVDAARELPALDPYLTAHALDVTFTPSKIDPDQTEPTHAVARGSDDRAVRAQGGGSILRARSVEAFIGRTDSGTSSAASEPVITDVIATGAAAFERDDGIQARAGIIKARPDARTAELISPEGGPPVVLAKAGSTIVGPRITLDDATGTLLVKGAGSFEHDPPDTSRQRRLLVTWSRGMRFNNLEGLIDCQGAALVTSATPLSTQVVRAESIRVDITPASAGSSGGVGPSGEPVVEDRRLLRAEAVGATSDQPGVDKPGPATVEVRNFAADPAAPADPSRRTLEQLMFIEGMRIIADEQAGRLTAPGAGRAIVRDQRQEGASPLSPGAAVAGASSPKGTSRFVWGDGMEFIRSTGVLSMRKDVEVTHLPMGSTQAIRLVALQVDAFFNLQGEAGGESPGVVRSADLLKAEASGAVYAESGGQKLLGDRLVYDAASGVAEATAAPGNRVTLYPRGQQPVTARRLLWNLRTDRIDVSEPAPTAGAR